MLMSKFPMEQHYYKTTIELWHEKQQVTIGYEYDPPCHSEFTREYLSVIEVEITCEKKLGYLIETKLGSGKYDKEAIRFDRVNILPVLSDQQIRMIEIEILEMLHERQLHHQARPGPVRAPEYRDAA